MGCLNPDPSYPHWCANIHLSGPCSLRCYYCIGQFMGEVDCINVLGEWPLPNLQEFVDECKKRRISEVNITGTNTDPLLYQYLGGLVSYLRSEFEAEGGVVIGARTNGLALGRNLDWNLFDKVGVIVPSLNGAIYHKMTGGYYIPDLVPFLEAQKRGLKLKAYIPLSPFNLRDVMSTISQLSVLGFRTIVLRELYGQEHVGNPCEFIPCFRDQKPKQVSPLNVPVYRYGRTEIAYWDVHYVEVNSLNLFANGVISDTYAIMEGYHPAGKVIPQSEFSDHCRRSPQWEFVDDEGNRMCDLSS